MRYGDIYKSGKNLTWCSYLELALFMLRISIFNKIEGNHGKKKERKGEVDH